MKRTTLGTPIPAYSVHPVVPLEHTEKTGKRTALSDDAPRSWHVPTELPVAFVINDVNYAIMMASPGDMVDFALGFTCTEGIIRRGKELSEVLIHYRDRGIDIRLKLDPRASARFSTRTQRRHLTANTSCGLCGLDSAERLFEKLPLARSGGETPSAQALQIALERLRDHQPLNQMTKSVHGAAWADISGAITLIREDVGRHNAVDKLIGALINQHTSLEDGFLLVSSRCSYEIIEKAARCGITNLLSVSAPTNLALEKAEEAGIRVFCREGQAIIQLKRIQSEYPEGIEQEPIF